MRSLKYYFLTSVNLQKPLYFFVVTSTPTVIII